MMFKIRCLEVSTTRSNLASCSAFTTRYGMTRMQDAANEQYDNFQYGGGYWPSGNYFDIWDTRSNERLSRPVERHAIVMAGKGDTHAAPREVGCCERCLLPSPVWGSSQQPCSLDVAPP